MKKGRQFVIEGPDELDILSAIWILACNDENPIVTYEGIRFRLGLPQDYDVRRLVLGRGEMFRRRVPSLQLKRWKEEMIGGKHRPSWIREMDNEGTRQKTIMTLTPDDVFRSQFRAHPSAPRSDIKIIDWGLQHIDRLRKARLEARGQTAKSWQMWLVLAVSVINILIALTK